MMITVEPSPALYLALKKRLEEMGKGDRAKEVLQKAIKEMAHSTKLRLHSETKAIYTIKRSAFKQSDIRVKNPLHSNGTAGQAAPAHCPGRGLYVSGRL